MFKMLPATQGRIGEEGARDALNFEQRRGL